MKVAVLVGIITFFVVVGTAADVVGQRAKVSLGPESCLVLHTRLSTPDRLHTACTRHRFAFFRRHLSLPLRTRPKLASLQKKWKSPKGALLRFEPQDTGREVHEPERKRDADGRVTAYRVSKGGISSTTVR